GKNQVSVGAAGDIDTINQTVSAAIHKGSSVTGSAGDVNVGATQNSTLWSVAADGSQGGTGSLVGSGSVLNVTTNTAAAIDAGTTVAADRNVGLTASRTSDTHTIDGGAALGGDAGFGVAVSYLNKQDTVDAHIGDGSVGQGATVTAKGNGAGGN